MTVLYPNLCCIEVYFKGLLFCLVCGWVFQSTLLLETVLFSAQNICVG